jgi:anti-anti-sigma regulatory factor
MGAVDTPGEKKKEDDMIHLKEISPEEVEVVTEGHLFSEDMTDFQAWLDRAFDGGYRLIALDFSTLVALSSAAIGKIWKFKQRCDEAGRSLRIRHCEPKMLELLKMIKFEALIDFEQ